MWCFVCVVGVGFGVLVVCFCCWGFLSYVLFCVWFGWGCWCVCVVDVVLCGLCVVVFLFCVCVCVFFVFFA
jgi:hypothetical protein